jgi:hypothetical protein
LAEQYRHGVHVLGSADMDVFHIHLRGLGLGLRTAHVEFRYAAVGIGFVHHLRVLLLCIESLLG